MVKNRANRLIDIINDSCVESLAIIGLAKNAGKTVTMNTLIKETQPRGQKITVVSYGRDGEDTDAITLKKKPHIFIPAGSYFVTGSEILKRTGRQARVICELEDRTRIGRVCLYENDSAGFEVELIGVNSRRGIAGLKEQLPADSELLLVDGALDRRSSAVPELADGIILATGAVVGNTEELIAERTMAEIERLMLPVHEEPPELIGKILGEGLSAVIYEGEIKSAGNTLFNISDSVDFSSIARDSILVLNGALTDRLAETLLAGRAENFSIVVRDGTRVFLNQRNMKLFRIKGIKLYVQSGIKLLALTINPYSPYGFSADSETLSAKIREYLERAGRDIPVYDVLSESY